MSTGTKFNRGDVVLLPITFVSGVGSKVRPAVVVQNDNPKCKAEFNDRCNYHIDKLESWQRAFAVADRYPDAGRRVVGLIA